MNLGIHKQSEGYWVRLMSFLGVGIMFAWGAAWIAGQMGRIDLPRDATTNEFVIEPGLLKGIVGLVVLVIGAAVAYWFAYNRRASSEFLIATESEMKKVNWSTRREIIGSTWVVIGIAFFFAILLLLIDLSFSNFFKAINILQSGG
jgi:preprotein translocase SecE subunit